MRKRWIGSGLLLQGLRRLRLYLVPLVMGVALGVDLGFERIRRTGEYAASYRQIFKHEPLMIVMGIIVVQLMAWISARVIWRYRIRLTGDPNREYTVLRRDVNGVLLPLLLPALQPLADEVCLSSPAGWIRIIAWLAVVISADTFVYRFVGRHIPSLMSERLKNRLVIVLICLVPVAWSAGLFGERRHPVGDEPSYLMITHSIAQDLDINMNDDYASRAYRRFYSGAYPMFTHLGTDGINYPHHSIGLPLLLAPVYRVILGSGWEAHLVFIMRCCMVLIYVLLAAVTFGTVRKFTGDVSAARWVVAVCFLSGPLLFFSAEIYPETSAALILLIGLRVLAGCRNRSCPFRWSAAMALAAVMPWLGIKYIAVASVLGGLLFVSMVRHEKRFIVRILTIMPACLSIAAYLVFLWVHYHNLNPVVIYTGVIPGTGTMAVPPGQPGFWETLPNRILDMLNFWWGMLLEQRIGVLFLSPVYLLVIPGIWIGWKKRTREVTYLLMLFVVYILVYGWQNNWGGYCPPNRQFIAVAPLAVVLLAFGWTGLKNRISQYYKYIASVFGWGFGWILVHHERWLYHTMNPHLSGGEANWLRAFSPEYFIRLPALFPLMMGDIRHPAANVIWSAVFVVLLWLIGGENRRRRVFGRSGSRRLRFTRGWISAVFIVGILYHWYFIPPGSFMKATPGQPFHSMIILDDHHLGWEKDGFWVEGGCLSRMILVFRHRKPKIKVNLYSLGANLAVVDFGNTVKRIRIPASIHRTLVMQARRMFIRGDSVYVKFNIYTVAGYRPDRLLGTSDTRHLGVFVRFERPL